jgi:hypothetical protein
MCSRNAEIASIGETRDDRATAHDLRNLFGIVSGAARLLDQSPNDERLASILTALKRVACRGESICDVMLSKAPGPARPVRDELDGAIAAAIPLVRPILTRDIGLLLDLKAGEVPIPLTAEDVETILIELVGNAVRHGEGASHIVIRSRRAAGRGWLIVADNGLGRLELVRAMHHGHGLLRLDLLIRGAGGDLQIRRTRIGGLVAAISFPESASPRSGLQILSQNSTKERGHENRQPVAA